MKAESGKPKAVGVMVNGQLLNVERMVMVEFDASVMRR